MAKSRESSVQDKIADLTECLICAEIFTTPKILPCVHTFCLHCLENYGKDKKPGDQMVCPICRNEFLIPDGGFCNLPNNFLIGKMVEIGKLAVAPANEAFCDHCPEGEEAIAKMYCIDCEQILCERCTKSHKKIKVSQSHHIVELGSKLDARNINLRNSYCDHHPKELIKMYCYDDNEAICLICCVESHESHRRINVEKAAGDFTERLKEDQRKVIMRLPECENIREELDKYKKEFTEEISKTEERIRDIGTKMKTLIDEHTEILIRDLKLVREQNRKAFEITKQDVERFRVMIDSYSRYCEELLTRGSAVDICRAADQLHTRANELEKFPANCSGEHFSFDTVVFQPSSFENVLMQCRSKNAVGELTVTESPGRIIKLSVKSTEKEELKQISETVTNLKPHQLDLIRTEEFKKKLKQEVPDLEFEVKQTEVNLSGMPEVVKKARLHILQKVTAAVQDSFEISESKSKVFAKEEVNLYLMEQLRKRGICASWTCIDRDLVVFASDDENLEEAIEVLKNEVVEAHLDLGAVHDLPRNFGQSPRLKDFVRCLCEEDRLLEVGVNHSVIFATCMRTSIKKIKGRIEDFIVQDSFTSKRGMFFRLRIMNLWQ